MSEFTPGPWEAFGTTVRVADEEAKIAEWAACRFYVANTSTDTRDPVNAKIARANAVLVAAAPDLLIQLKAARAMLEGYHEDVSSEPFVHVGIDEAIAKATGATS